jgi:hypothetical protein
MPRPPLRLTATQLLSRDGALKHIPVIAQTAQPASLDRDRGLFFGFLRKAEQSTGAARDAE